MKTIKKFNNIESFETQRLFAVKLGEHDLDKFTSMHTEPQTMATLGGLRSAEETKKNLAWNLQHWRENGFGLWMYYLKDTGVWIGRGGLRRINIEGKEEIEVGYALMPEFWNQGYGTEIAKASIEIAFEALRLQNIVCFTTAENIPSLNVMQKAGFKYERDVVINHNEHVLTYLLHRMISYRKAEVVPYNKNWPDYFAEEAKKIQAALGTSLKRIHHIGSTSIPDMPAKPIIDMLLELDDINDVENIKNKLHALGYVRLSRQIIPHRSFFTSKTGFNLHLYEQGDPQARRHLNFRDYVIQHPVEAKAYAELKYGLSEQFRDDINKYVVGKDKLVQEIDTKAKLWEGRNQDYLAPVKAEIKNLSQELLLKAMTANLNIHMTYFVQYLNQVELVRVPGYTIVNSGLYDDTFNYVLDADFSDAIAGRIIDEITDYFKSRHIPYSWWISPLDKPETLASHLEEKGYKNTENNTAMYLDLDTWGDASDLLPELKIIPAQNDKTLHDFAMVLANDPAAFSQYFAWIATILTADDPVEFYVGYVNDKPVVRYLTCYYAGVAGLYWLSTAEDERKKGYGTAMLKYHLKRAKELGYHVAVLQASADGLDLYKKLGYKECGVFKEFK